MLKMLDATQPGEYVKLWAKVLRNEGNGAVHIGVPREVGIVYALGVVVLSSDTLAEAVESAEPWPGEVVRSFLTVANRDLASWGA